MVLASECSAFCCAHALTDPATSAPVLTTIASTLTISADEELLNTIRAGYDDDPWCKRLQKAKILPHGVREVDGLLYAGE